MVEWVIAVIVIVFLMITAVTIAVTVNVGKNRNWPEDDEEQMKAIEKINLGKNVKSKSLNSKNYE